MIRGQAAMVLMLLHAEGRVDTVEAPVDRNCPTRISSSSLREWIVLAMTYSMSCQRRLFLLEYADVDIMRVARTT